MAHWAQLDENNIVINVIKVEDGVDDGQSWVESNLDGKWLQTSINTKMGVHLNGKSPLRKNYAVIGSLYSEELDAFIPQKLAHQADFVLDEASCIWVPPIPFPEDATWVMGYQLDVSVKELEVVDESGNKTIELVPDLPEDAKIYYWINDPGVWAMNPNSETPRPTDDHVWNPIEKVWFMPSEPEPSQSE